MVWDKKHSVVLLIQLLLSATFPSPAEAAQLERTAPTGSHIPKTPEQLSDERARQLVHDFAACVVKHNPGLASEYVLDRTIPFNFPPKYRALFDSDCLFDSKVISGFDDAVALRLNDPRSALADALIASNKGQIKPDRIVTAAPLAPITINPSDYVPKKNDEKGAAAALQERRTTDESRIRLYAYGDCVVRQNPQGAEQLVNSNVNSAAEQAAFQTLMPSFSACLDDGVQINFSPEMLRGVVAYNYYVLAHQPAVVPTVTEAH